MRTDPYPSLIQDNELPDISKYHNDKYSHIPLKDRYKELLPVRDSKVNPKIQRNELCPCGSGKKYKKCCYHSD
jgi:preprotein translocase subunit SecA